MELKMSTIMASYLGAYDGCATKRDKKFCRAVDSWLAQSYYNKELIIVSDGCDKTNKLYEKKFSSYKNIKLVKLQKQELFSGYVRQAGLNTATGDVICYLDTDDYFNAYHIANIENRMFEMDYDWCYYADQLKINDKLIHQRPVSPSVSGLIGTSNIAHKKNMKSDWVGCDGYGHDYVFVQRLKRESSNYDQIFGCGYIVCHIVNRLDN